MEIYVGYIVREGETNPYSVWIPTKNGGATFKNFKTFASNASSFNSLDLNTLQAGSEKCYMIMEPTAQNSYMYDTLSGLGTVQEHNYNPGLSSIRDVKSTVDMANEFFSPHDGEYVESAHANPAYNGLQIYLPSSSHGTEINSFTNAPGGHHTTLEPGTKVLVMYPDGRGVGYIVGQIPFPDETSKIIKDITG
ncbi:MAG: hypothetical protein IJ341_12535 [Bacteroidales bacterium]|nr:hypothetical protein [Bacteroidales bacterium]